jgi:thiol-disulfide isomerase/thioredoxin
MKYIYTFTAVFIFSFSFSQNVSVIKISDLENRLNNNNDTTYIINFWATWCAPCIKELPDFDSIAKTVKGKLKIIYVTLDFKEEIEKKVIPFLIKKPLHSEVMLLDESNGNYFIPKISSQWSGAIPATLILNNKNKYRNFYEKKLDYGFLMEEIKKSGTEISY